MPLVSTGPLRGRVRWRDELRLRRAGGAEGRIVQCRQIRTDSLSCIRAKVIGVPLVAGNRALLVGIRRDQARIDGKAFATDQPLAQAAFHHRLEQMPQDIALPETAVPVAREGRMVGHLAVQPQTAKPSVSQVEMDLLAQAPFGPDAQAVAHDQHPHHQFRIDRGPADHAVKGL
jgi:hypothetical protein